MRRVRVTLGADRLPLAGAQREVLLEDLVSDSTTKPDSTTDRPAGVVKASARRACPIERDGWYDPDDGAKTMSTGPKENAHDGAGIALDTERVDAEAARRPHGGRRLARAIDGDLARLIAEGRVGTAAMLGFSEAEILHHGDVDDALVLAQVDDYLRKDSAQSRRGGEYKAWEAKYPAWVEWRERVASLRSTPSAIAALREIVGAEVTQKKRAELVRDAETYLRDRHLEWAEHEKMLHLARELGLGDKEVEWAYGEVMRRGGFEITRGAPPSGQDVAKAIAPTSAPLAPAIPVSVPSLVEARSEKRRPVATRVESAREPEVPPKPRPFERDDRPASPNRTIVWLLGAVAVLLVVLLLRSLATSSSDNAAMMTPTRPYDPPSVPEPATARPVAVAPAAAPAFNDGTSASRPVLSAADEGFDDGVPKGGRNSDDTFNWGGPGSGWGDRCYRNLQAGKLGWAKAECEKGLEVADPTQQQPRASLLYNLGLIECGRYGGSKDPCPSPRNAAAARMYFLQSLALRPNPEVQRALDSLP